MYSYRHKREVGKKRNEPKPKPQPPVSYAPEQVIPQMPTDLELMEPVPNTNIDINSFLDDIMADEEGGNFDGYVE